MASSGQNEFAKNWLLLAVAIIGISLPGAAYYALGQVTQQLEAEFGWSRTEVSSGLMVSLLFSFFLGPVAGRLVDITSARLLAILGGVLSALAMAGFSLADGSRGIWFLLWCFQSVATALVSPVIWFSVLNWRFTTHRSFAIGIALCGVALSQGLGPPAMRYLVDTFDWRHAYQLMGLFWCGGSVLMTILFFFDDRPNRRTSTAAPVERRPGHMRNLFLSANFVKIALAMFLLLGSGSALMLHLSPALVDNGFSLEVAAALAGIGGGFGDIVGKLAMGWLFDRVRLHVVTLGMTVAFAVACLWMALGIPQLSAALAACLLLAAAGGGIVTISACLTTRFLPAEDFGLAYGGVCSVMAVAAALGPVGASLIHDQFGSYKPAFWCGIAAAVLATVLITSLMPVSAVEEASVKPVETF